ncbi:unnamed protein product [Cuscuta campestris]|uniref:Uncharacterized protein n=1 Tax=Cuscuta campestris TaxID=132261 RepID=A0A484MZA4_9ASTE|nr:unnamed protein product [Cuscuta campestris]
MMILDAIHKFLNMVAPPFTFFTLLLFWPPYQIFKLFLSLLDSTSPEDVSGKVVVITGASSGIGEHLAYEYAQRGASLVLAARREGSLNHVANRARELGAPDVAAIRADVSIVDDCRRIVDQAISHFGRMDILVNNAGVTSISLFEEVHDVTSLRSVMDINFWGSVYMTRFASSHLRKTNGKIVVISSSATWLSVLRMSIYNASKAAMSQFFETVDADLRDAQVNIIPIGKVEGCTKAIVSGACRGKRYLTEPAWFKVTQWWKVFFPEVVEYSHMLLAMCSAAGSSPLGKKILGYTRIQKILYPKKVREFGPKFEYICCLGSFYRIFEVPSNDTGQNDSKNPFEGERIAGEPPTDENLVQFEVGRCRGSFDKSAKILPNLVAKLAVAKNVLARETGWDSTVKRGESRLGGERFPIPKWWLDRISKSAGSRGLAEAFPALPVVQLVTVLSPPKEIGHPCMKKIDDRDRKGVHG